jgi:putative glutamine amidotransferase
MEKFGHAMHPKAQPVDARRQEFELALLDGLDKRREKPALGVCLGMQIMALHAGGKLNQHLADTLGETGAALHLKDNRHLVDFAVHDTPLLGSPPAIPVPQSEISLLVPSWHHQAVASPGSLRIVATAPDGVIEAVDDPSRPFYAGVQWHPERGGDGELNLEVLRRFVDAARRTRG